MVLFLPGLDNPYDRYRRRKKPKKPGKPPTSELPKAPKKKRRKKRVLPKAVKKSKSRYRERIERVQRTFIGRHQSFDTNGAPLTTTDHWREESFVSDKRFKVERCWDQRNPGPPYRVGGPFQVVKASNPWFDVDGVGRWEVGGLPAGSGVTIRHVYAGGFVPTAFGVGDEQGSSNLANVGVSGPFSGTYLDGTPYGASAYNRYKPQTDGSAGLAVALGEAGEIPDMLRSSARGFRDVFRSLGGQTDGLGLMKPGKVADHFLNHQFGWVPFVNDLRSFKKTFDNTETSLAQLKRDNGQWVKRGGRYSYTDVLLNINQHESDNAPLVFPALHAALLRFPDPARPNKWGRTTTYRRETDTVWFEGRFRYYVAHWDPVFVKYASPSRRKFDHIQDIMRLYGARISPSTVWNLCPWTWLVDWGTNAGDVVDNLVTFMLDGLVSKYAFIMRHRSYQAVNESVIYLWDHEVPSSSYGRWVQEIDTKDRRSASPFGFSTTWDGFSLRQLGILAALGITRA